MPPTNGNYVTIEDIRDEDIDPVEASDQKISDKIKQAERFIEMKTGRWFYRKVGITFLLDGGDRYFDPLGIYKTTDVLNLSVPVLNLTGISIDGIVRNIANYIVFNRIGPPVDDRWFPKIFSKNIEWPEQGIQNISLTGDFGFVEDTVDYLTPEPIKSAARKLAVRLIELEAMTGDEAVDRQMRLNIGNIQSETLPGYSYKLFDRGKNEDVIYYTGDYEIDSTIETYRYKRFVVSV